MSGRVYLDHAATTPMRPEAIAAVAEGMTRWANPSSPHAEGRAARTLLEDARERIKAALGWDGELLFTGGASEAAAMAVERTTAPAVMVSAVEHDAVLRVVPDAPRLPTSPAGLVALPRDAGRALCAIQHVNSETGVVQPHAPDDVARFRGQGDILFADCAQSAGKRPLPDADLIAVSAHKLGGPVGIGALLVRDLALLRPTGGQEQGYRPGTENLPAVLGFAAALEADTGWLADAARFRAALEAELVAAGAEVVAAGAERLPTIGAYRMPGVPAAVQLIRFDMAGIAVSAGSACSSGTLRPSHVLTAMGWSPSAAGEVVRVSFGWTTTETDIERFAAAWRQVAERRQAA